MSVEREVWSARCHALRAALRRVELRHPAIPTHLSVVAEDGKIRLLVRLRSPHRDSGQMCDTTHRCPVADDMTIDRFVRFVEQRVCAAWVHELEESFHLDGTRIRDPHPHTWLRFILYGPDDPTIE